MVTLQLSQGGKGPHCSQDMCMELSIPCHSNVLVDTNQMPGMLAYLARESWDLPSRCLLPCHWISSLWAGQIESTDMLGPVA
jgi:hypothetical protein